MSKKTNSKSASKKANASKTATKPEATKKAKVKQPTTPAEKIKAYQEKYPDQKITPDSLVWDEGKQKFSVEITCQHPGCTNKRRVFSSDLFQVRLCPQHTKEARRKKRKAKRNEAKEALKAAVKKA